VWAADATVFLKRDAKKGSYSIDYKLPDAVAAPIKAGQTVGSGEIIVEGKPQQTIALIAPSDVPVGSLFQRLMGYL
jgi:Penicillin-binding protein 5, C-terminal domain